MNGTTNFSNKPQAYPTSGIMFKDCLVSAKLDHNKNETALSEAKDGREMLDILLKDDFALMQFIDWSVRGALNDEFKFKSGECQYRTPNGQPIVYKKGEPPVLSGLDMAKIRGATVADYNPHFDDIYCLCKWLSTNHPGLTIDSSCHNPPLATRLRAPGTLTVHHHFKKKTLIIETDCSLADDTYHPLRRPSSNFEYYRNFKDVSLHKFVNMETALARIYVFIDCDPDDIASHPTSQENVTEKMMENSKDEIKLLMESMRKEAEELKEVEEVESEVVTE